MILLKRPVKTIDDLEIVSVEERSTSFLKNIGKYLLLENLWKMKL